VQDLLRAHLAFSYEHTPAEHVYALDLDGLVDPSVTFCSARVDSRLVAIGALKELDPAQGELKSMHTAEAGRRTGIGRAMLDHLVGLARTRGYHRVSLETGSMSSYAPARALYLSAGFAPCGPFAGYPDSDTSSFFTILL
jgi:putative acetyltransferase